MSGRQTISEKEFMEHHYLVERDNALHDLKYKKLNYLKIVLKALIDHMASAVKYGEQLSEDDMRNFARMKAYNDIINHEERRPQ